MEKELMRQHIESIHPVPFDFEDPIEIICYARLEWQRQRKLGSDDPHKLPAYGRYYPIDELAGAAVVRITELYGEIIHDMFLDGSSVFLNKSGAMAAAVVHIQENVLTNQNNKRIKMKTFLGILASVIALYSYVPYFRDIFAGKTKPHAFSWLVWFLLTAIGFVAQVQDNAGAGAWVTGFTAFIAFFIFVVSVMFGEKKIAPIDWWCLFGAFVAMGIWAVTSTPLYSVIIITIIDALGFAPTFRKAFIKPFEETMITYALSAMKFIIAIVALSNFSVVTALYPASLVAMNGLFVLMLIVRRRAKAYELRAARH